MKCINLFFTLILFLFVSCDQSTEPGNSSKPYVPMFENDWSAESDSTHTISLESDDFNLSSGLFIGSESDPNNNISSADICGRFDNRSVEFNIRRPKGTVKYKGSFINDNRIEATSPFGSIVLIRPTQ